MAEMNYMQRAKSNGYNSLIRVGRQRSLIDDAHADRLSHSVKRQSSAADHRLQLLSRQDSTVKERKFLSTINDEGIEIIWQSVNDDVTLPCAVTLSIKGAYSMTVVATCIQIFVKHDLLISHVSTRPPIDDDLLDAHLQLTCHKQQLIDAVVEVEDDDRVANVKIYPLDKETEHAWFPRCASELDKCSHVATKYEPELDCRHPGYGDSVYIARRAELCKFGIDYRYGDPLPFVAYSAAEHKTWHDVYVKLKALYPVHACAAFLRNLQVLEEVGLYGSDKIPQLEPINRFLQSRTGFQLRPCGGLLSARDFLASLALRTFQATLYLRHGANPHHSPEPDLIHELLGHVPMLADDRFAQFSQEIGLASLGASDVDIERLATVYWFIIEFGLCKENGQLKVCGAGLLSAYGELLHAVSDTPEHRPFDPSIVALQSFSDSDYQPIYYVADSVTNAMQLLRYVTRALLNTQHRKYAGEIQRPFSVIYDAHARSIRKVITLEDVQPTVDSLRYQLTVLDDALAKCRANTSSVTIYGTTSHRLLPRPPVRPLLI